MCVEWTPEYGPKEKIAQVHMSLHFYSSSVAVVYTCQYNNYYVTCVFYCMQYVTDLLKEKAEMLKDYFSIEIGEVHTLKYD